MGPVFWNGAATAAIPSSVLTFLLTFFVKKKSKEINFFDKFFLEIVILNME
jgi:hypothetical protein